MTPQPGLFDPSPAVRGMGEASSHANPADLASIRLHAESLASRGLPFTADDVYDRLSETQRERMDAFPQSAGGVWFQMAREGLIQKVSYAPSRRSSARGRPIAVWRGVHVP